ncbi:hypothetical protein SAMN05421595_1713 [Austwickia chelonae]|uniref:Lipoprotein n=1 Tax=Austwickia chelonae NBRC 105200 TaxID=1184607 RepID=K6V3F1_9MICO|nr:hypothetical protein [Austwickia chelonae]GAB76583.1 hypothetical protein AUCHE_01_01450 [Austwickia chelonae NBRC 105200]SEW27350.1 hypothetical protein SAMN05421595_1713 [Austwickia chelonae]
MNSALARRLTMLVLAAPLALTACSGGSSPQPTGAASSSAPNLGELQPGQQVDKNKFFETARFGVKQLKSHSFTSEYGKSGSVMTSSGVIDNSDPGNVKRQVTMKSPTGKSQDFVVADKFLYSRTSNSSDKWIKAPVGQRADQILASVSAVPDDSKNLVQLITYVGEEDVNGKKTKHFSLTLNAPTGSTAAATGDAGTSKVEYWLDDKYLPRKMVNVVNGLPSTTLYDKWGEPVTITVPPEDQVTLAPSTTPPGSPAPTASSPAK